MNTATLLREIREELEGLIDDMLKLESQTVSAPKHGDAEGAKEEFEKITTQWKKFYGNVGDSAKLLQEDKRKTRIAYSHGANRKLAEKRISDTDLLLHGLHLFMSDKEGKKINPPVLPDAFSAMMLSNKDIILMQSWLVKQKETADDTIRACEKLKRRLKELLAEKKRLKTENKTLLHHSQNLEKELNDLPTEEKIAAMRQEILDLKEKIYVLNQQHIDSLNAKECINNSIQTEVQKRTEFVEAMKEKISNLKDDLVELKRFAENVTDECNTLVSGPFRTFLELLNTIWKLKSLLDRMHQLLETRSSHLTQMKADVELQIKCGEDMKTRLTVSQTNNNTLAMDLDTLYENAECVGKSISKMQKTTAELLSKATASSTTLLSDFNLEEFKKQKDDEFKVSNSDFIRATKDFDKFESAIKSFETQVRDSVKVESHDYVSATWNTNRESLLWEEKIVCLVGDADKLDDLISEAKEKSVDEKKDIMDAMTTLLNKKDDSGFSQGLKYSMSTTMLLSDLTKEHEYTLTGEDNFTKSACDDK